VSRLLVDPSMVNRFDQGEDPRWCSRLGVRDIVYARGAPGHTDYCGTGRSGSPIRAS
jgi:hypothetical protein